MQPTTQGRDYYEYALLSVPASSCACTWDPWLKDKVKGINYNDPQHVYQTLKQEFELETAANYLDKLSKFLNALQSTGESTVQFGGCMCGLLCEWKELWMHVILCGLMPGFQHIRNGYASAENQNTTTLEWLLDSNDAMDSVTGPQAAFATQIATSSMLNSAGCLYHQHPPSLFDSLWCETNGNHFTEKCCNLQRSKEQHKANHTQSKASTSKG